MLTKTENMPRGGTLVVVPTTIVRQWEQEIEKTLKDPDEISVLRWTDAHRTIDCNEIAQYDIVITTPQQVTKDSTMSSIYWHRIAVDEAQLNAGSMMQSGILLSTHRWIVSGTPCNAHPETLKPSLEFLRLGGYSDAQKHLPPALATVMRAVMCRYTMNGTIEGEKNLQLKALHQKVIPCQLNDEDIEDEKEVGRQAFRIFSSTMLKGMKKCACPPNVSIEDLISNRGTLNNIAKSGHVKTLTMKRQMEHVRAVVAGGHHVLVPGQFVFNNRTQQDEPETRFFQSKAQHVTSCIVRIREADPEAKCIVFSQYEETLKSIGELLKSEGLTHRALYGGTSAKKRAEAIELFMTDPPTKVFLLAAKSGAVGVTLTSANHVFICEPQMNPAVEAQAIGRSHRMGQEKQVTVHRFYTQNTIEERVRELVARKHNASGSQMVSTAMAANPGAGEVHCNLADYYNLLKVDLGDSDDEEEDVMVLN
jgi:SNF2 family DNA or RNA helicase